MGVAPPTGEAWTVGNTTAVGKVCPVGTIPPVDVGTSLGRHSANKRCQLGWEVDLRVDMVGTHDASASGLVSGKIHKVLMTTVTGLHMYVNVSRFLSLSLSNFLY